jgi:uncharacterized protein YkwD
MRSRTLPSLAVPLVALSILSPWGGDVVAATHASPIEAANASGLSRVRMPTGDAAIVGAVGLPTPGTRTASEDELAMLELTNAERARHGVPPLEFDVEVLQVARLRAAAQASEPALSHLDGDGEIAFGRLLDEIGLPYAAAAENLARLDVAAPAPQWAQDALMRSREHRDNILNPAFTRLAVGIVVDASGRTTVAELFCAAP